MEGDGMGHGHTRSPRLSWNLPECHEVWPRLGPQLYLVPSAGRSGGSEQHIVHILSLMASGDCHNTCHKTDRTYMKQTRRRLEG